MKAEKTYTAPPEILVVDDTPANLQLLAQILTGHGYQVRPAFDGFLALQSAAAKKPDLILLDVRMPGLEGYEVCRRLKADALSQDIPVLFISALGETADKVKGFEAGGVDFITKPFQEEEVLARVSLHLRLRELSEHLEQKVEERTRELSEANDKLQLEINERIRAEAALQESKERYLTLFETANDAIFLMDGPTFLECNPKTVKFFGCENKDEIIGRSPVDFSPLQQPDGQYSKEKAMQLIDRALRESPQFFYWKHQRKDGMMMDAEVSLNRLSLNGNIYLQAIVRDISERMRAEDALRESESRFRNLAEATFEGIVVTENGLIIDANRQFAQMVGYPLSEVYGMPLISFVISMDKQWAENVLATGEEHIGEYRVRKKDGSEIYVESHGRGFDINQRRERMTSVRDITERKRAEEALSHEAERSKVIARIAARLNASLGLQEVLDAVCEETAHILGVPVSMVWLLDDDQKYFNVHAAFGLPPEIYAQLLPAPNTLKSLRQKTPQNIHFLKDIQQDQDNPNVPLAEKLGLHATMNCWFYYEYRLIGLLTVLRHEFAWNYSESEITLMDTLSNQIAIAIHHAQLYEQVKSGRARLQLLSEKLVDIQEAERRHLAIELHDEIGQALTQVKMSLDRFDPAHPEKGNLESARELTLDLMKRVRGLSLELRPTILDDLGLLPAVLWHIERHTSLTGIQVDFKPRGVDQRFRAQVESTTYRILQEALTNVARHAAATHVSVSLWADEEFLGLQVEDDGVGFDLAAAQHKLTGGLSGMRERAEICGGRLLIDSNPGRGTYISLELPIQSDYVERRSR